MKKLYIKKKYKAWHDNRSKKIALQKSKVRLYFKFRYKIPINRNHKSEYIIKDEVLAPENLCVLEDTEKCLEFFRNLRRPENINKIGRICFVKMSLKKGIKI